MAIFQDAQTDSASLAKLVNEDTDVTTRYGAQPKKSIPKVLREFEEEAAESIAEFDQVIDQYKENRGFNTKGTFAAGFTYELPNDVGLDDSGNPWILIDTSSLPVTVTAGTTPTNPPYKQVAYGTAAQVSTNTSDTVQSFVDSFALKIFQSPTDGLTEINTRTLLGGEVYEVRKVSDNSFADIYTDKESLIPITQNGTSNVSGSDGVVGFYIADGDYYVAVDSVQSNFSVYKTSDISRSVTLNTAISEDSQEGTRYTLNDLDDAKAITVSSSDTDGFFYGSMASGRKLKLDFDITTPNGLNGNNLGLVYDSNGVIANPGTDNTAKLQAGIDLIKTKLVGLGSEYTGSKMHLGFGGLLITSELDLTNNAAVSISGLGKTKTNIIASTAFTDTYMLNLTGSNNCRNEIRGLRITTVGGSEGVIRSAVNAMGSNGGANQIDVKENWINNLTSMYAGVASDSSFKDNTTEFCRQLVNITGGGSRDLDISENVVYNCGNIGIADPSSPLYYFSDVENLTIERNRVINDSPCGPFDFGVYRLINVHNFDIRNEKYNDSQSYVGTMFRLEGSSGRLYDLDIPSLTDRAIRATDCPYLELDKIKINDEKGTQDDLGASILNCETVTIGTLTIGRTGLTNLVIDGSTTVTIDTLILSGASQVAAVGGGFDSALKLVNCDNVSINKVVILQPSVGANDIVVDATVSNLYIGVVQGTSLSRIQSNATNSVISNVQP